MSRLSAAARPIYALGSFGSSLLQQTVLLWAFYFYAPPAGSDLPARAGPAAVGLALAAGRVIDAVADPIVANWSDRLRGRWGRRRPFILAAAPLLVVCFVALWFPPGPGPGRANAIFMAVVLGLFFFLYTMTLNPYMALLPEITSGGSGRISTVSWMTALNLLGVGGAYILSSWLAAAFGFRTMSLVLAPIALAALIAPVFIVRETLPTHPPQPFMQSLTGVLSDRRFRIYVLGLATIWLGLSMVTLSLAPIITVLIGLPQSAVALVLGAGLAATILALPFVSAAVRRFGARLTLLAAMALLVLELPLLAGVGRWPVGLSVQTQGYALIALAGPAIGSLFLLPNVLIAHIAENHAVDGRGRNEGMFFAFQGLIFNGTTSLSAAALGALIERFGYGPPGISGLRVALLLAAGCVAAGFLIFLKYPHDVPQR